MYDQHLLPKEMHMDNELNLKDSFSLGSVDASKTEEKPAKKCC